MRSAVHYLPLLTTALSTAFAVEIFRHWKSKENAPHLAWWTFGILLFGVGTATESLITLFGWQESFFRAWYISGALLGGSPLAQGTVCLLLSRKTANFHHSYGRRSVCENADRELLQGCSRHTDTK